MKITIDTDKKTITVKGKDYGVGNAPYKDIGEALWWVAERLINIDKYEPSKD